MRIYLNCILALAIVVAAWALCPARLARWAAGLCRLGWYRMTRWMPRGEPDPDGAPLTLGEKRAFEHLARQCRQRGVSATEPERRQP